MDTTIIIQGPIHAHGLEQISKYSKLGKVIVSTDSFLTSNYFYLETCLTGDIGFLISPLPDYPYYTNAHHIFEHAWSVYKPLCVTDTEYAVKVRCDEKYDNLGFFIDEVRKHPEKITTCNIFFKKSTKEPFHPSDHIIGGRTERMKRTFAHLVRKCIEYPDMRFVGSDFGLPWMSHVSPETAICLSALYMFTQWDLPQTRDNERISELMKMYFHLVDINNLGRYIWTKKTESGRGFYDNFNDNDESIFSIEEV